MFPRIKTITKKSGKVYKYLVLSESIRKNGKKSYTNDIAVLGSVQKFNKDEAEKLINGLVRIFQLESHVLVDGVEIVESLEYGNIIFWQKLWGQLQLGKTISQLVSRRDKSVTLAVSKYIEIMAVNRCIAPGSKLSVTRWRDQTCYREMKGYSDLSMDVNCFYRSMDQFLKIKDEFESVVFERLKNLFSINVRLTFYDITSSFFYTDNCPIGAHGYSRDNRSDREQIVIGVVTSYEGYPIKHYVFDGNTKDESTVEKVVNNLKNEFSIEETVFVGDRGMISKLNLERIEGNGFDYIMGVKHRQDEVCRMLFSEDIFGGNDYEMYNDLKVHERRVSVRQFLLWYFNDLLVKKGIHISAASRTLFANEISTLNDQSENDYKGLRELLRGMSPEIDSSLSTAIVNKVRKYQGKYDSQLRYVICLNEERKKSSSRKRSERLAGFSGELDRILSEKVKEQTACEREKAIGTLFTGYKAKYRKFFSFEREKKTEKIIGYCIIEEAVSEEARLDGIFTLLTSRDELSTEKVVESYKNLQEVELLYDDLKNFVDIRPIRHWLENRVRAHVFICVVALLLKRMFEIGCLKGKAVTKPLEEISKVKLVKYNLQFEKTEERTRQLHKVTTVTPEQKKYFNLIGIKSPMNIGSRFVVETKKNEPADNQQ